MRILSFDVGIRNLAACLLEYDPQDESSLITLPVKILWWNSFDLLDTPVHTCKVCCKNSVICNKPCTWQGLSPNESLEFFCGHHKSMHVYTPLTVDNCETKQLCDYGNCKGRGKFSVTSANESLASTYCKKHLDKTLAAYKSSHSLRKIKTPNCKDIPIKTLKISIWKLLDSLSFVLQVDKVIIENQPSLKNPIMKSIAETIFNYFICRGIIDRDRTNSIIDDIKYICPSNKMKLSDDGNNLKNISNKVLKYKATKQLAIQQVAERLSCQPTARDRFLDNKKKDDLADALLQALYFLKTQGFMKTDLSVAFAF